MFPMVSPAPKVKDGFKHVQIDAGLQWWRLDANAPFPAECVKLPKAPFVVYDWAWDRYSYDKMDKKDMKAFSEHKFPIVTVSVLDSANKAAGAFNGREYDLAAVGTPNRFNLLQQARARLKGNPRAGLWDTLRPIDPELLKYFKVELNDLEKLEYRVDRAGNVLFLRADDESPMAWDVDHIFPWARGGVSTDANLQVLQWAANRVVKNEDFWHDTPPDWLKCGITEVQFVRARKTDKFYGISFSLFTGIKPEEQNLTATAAIAQLKADVATGVTNPKWCPNWCTLTPHKQSREKFWARCALHLVNGATLNTVRVKVMGMYTSQDSKDRVRLQFERLEKAAQAVHVVDNRENFALHRIEEPDGKAAPADSPPAAAAGAGAGAGQPKK